jgi:hypothetical protein
LGDNDRNQTTDVRDIVALSDLGEWKNMTTSDTYVAQSTRCRRCMTGILPDNNTNKILAELRRDPNTRSGPGCKGSSESPFNFELQKILKKYRPVN